MVLIFLVSGDLRKFDTRKSKLGPLKSVWQYLKLAVLYRVCYLIVTSDPVASPPHFTRYCYNIARVRTAPHYVMCRAAYGGAGDSAESCWGEFLFYVYSIL